MTFISVERYEFLFITPDRRPASPPPSVPPPGRRQELAEAAGTKSPRKFEQGPISFFLRLPAGSEVAAVRCGAAPGLLR